MRELSYWEQKSLLPSSDIIIIGAGIVGLSAARIIAEKHPQYSVSIIEKDIIGSTASSRNAGFACFGSLSEILTDLKTMNPEQVTNLIQTRKQGLRILVERYGSKNLGFNRCGGYELYNEGNQFEKDAIQLEEINKLINSQSVTFEVVTTPKHMKFYDRCFMNKEEGHLDTGLLCRSLIEDCEAAGVKIYRGIEVISLEEGQKEVEVVLKNYGSIKAAQVIVATNALTRRLLPSEPVIAARNQVLVTTPINNLNLRGTFHMDAGYVYFRDIRDRVLIGGARHLFDSESTDEHGLNQENISYLRSILEEKVLPECGSIEIAYRWSGIIAPQPSKLPIVKKYSDRITLGVRLGGMGVAIGMNIGQKVATLCIS